MISGRLWDADDDLHEYLTGPRGTNPSGPDDAAFCYSRAVKLDQPGPLGFTVRVQP